MELWWQSLSTAEHVLLYVAVPATLILLLQTLLLFLGGDAPDLDGDGVPDALEAGADADLDGDGIPDTPGESSAPLHILTLRGVVAFCCLFGWGSLGLSQAGLPLWLALFFMVLLCGVLGLLQHAQEEAVPAEALELLEQRQQARAARDFARADALRDQLKALGYAVEDTKQGPKLRPLN